MREGDQAGLGGCLDDGARDLAGYYMTRWPAQVQEELVKTRNRHPMGGVNNLVAKLQTATRLPTE